LAALNRPARYNSHVLSDIKIPPYKYFPTHVMDSEGPKQWARVRLLQACERLNIPNECWPKVTVKEPKDYGYSYRCGRLQPLAFPSFFPLYESESEWRSRAQIIFNEFLNREAYRFRQEFQGAIDQKRITPIKQVRDTTPLELRYEWAAKRFCLHTPFRELASDGYTVDRIRKSVSEVLKVAGLSKDIRPRLAISPKKGK